MPSLFKRIKNFFTGRRNEPKRTQSPKTEGSGISGKDEVLNNEVVIVAELPPPPTEIVAPFEEEELIPQSSPSPTPEAISTVPTTLPPLDDALSRAIYEAVSDTWSGLKDNFESSSTAKNFGFRVIAAFVAVDERQFVQPMVLSIGTGSKWLSGKHLALDGGTVHDCHAEIIALRALRRLLIEQLQAIGEGRPVTPSLLEPRSDAAAASAQNGPHFRLKSGLKLYLYISRPPCGDAQCWRYFADSAGRLRVKLRATGGSTHQALPSSSSCPTVADFNRLKTGGGTATFMSCSDKVLMWNVVGLQGALLSALVEPMYLSGVVVSDYHGPGGLTLQQTLQRALYGRVDAAQLAAKLQQSSSSSSSSSPPLFALNRPLISFAEPYDHQDQFQFSPKKFDRPISLNWFRPPLVHSSSCRSNEVELINTESGRLYEVAAAGEGGGDSPSTTPPSRLCKRALLDSYRLLVAAKNLSSSSGASSSSSSSSSSSGTVKEKLLSDRLSGTYLELKQRSAPSYMAAKWALKETLAGQGLGRWRSAPAHVDLFTVQS